MPVAESPKFGLGSRKPRLPEAPSGGGKRRGNSDAQKGGTLLSSISVKTDVSNGSTFTRKPGDISIAAKEEWLQFILAKEALKGAERLRKQHLDKSIMGRNSVLPERIAGLNLDFFEEYLPSSPTGADPEDLDLSDDELTSRYNCEHFIASPGSEMQLPPDLARRGGVRLGLSLPTSTRRQEPYQEEVFVASCGQYTLLGIVNSSGHGWIGSQLASFVSQEMPSAVFRSAALAQHDSAAALTSAFHQVHESARSALDLSLTGASCTVALFDHQRLTVAHVGDCRAVLGVPDQSGNAEWFHFLPVSLTEDHHLSNKDEFDRVTWSGGETRKLIGDSIYRVYLPGEVVPGLATTRAIGHSLGHSVGVLHRPFISVVSRAQLPATSFLLLGSGGFWTTMSERAAVNWVSRYFADAESAAASLAKEGLRRWEEPNCPAKASLSPDVEDSFGVVVAFFDGAEQAEVLSPRPFVVTAATSGTARQPLAEVTSLGRVEEMRRCLPFEQAFEELLQEAEASSLQRP